MTGEPQDAIVWRRSSACEGGACVEVAIVDATALVRNSAHPGHVLVVGGYGAWREFLAAAKEGIFGFTAMPGRDR